MAASTGFINDVKTGTESMSINVRIIRLWKQTAYENPNVDGSLEMILMDTKLAIIQFSVYRRWLTKFAHLEEGQCITLSNFSVTKANTKFKVSKHESKIIVIKPTTVNVSEENHSIPRYGFRFVSFDAIFSKQLDANFLIDLIGNVVAIGTLEITTVTGKKKKKLILDLGDNGERILKLTLWDQFAQDAYDYISSNCNDNIVLILQYVQMKEFNREMSVSNSLFATRLLFNADLPEVISFKSRFDAAICSSASTVTQQRPTQPSISRNSQFLNVEERKTIAELTAENNTGAYVTLATIVCVDEGKGWFYIACKKCNKQVVPLDIGTPEDTANKGSQFHCKKMCC